MPWRHHFRCSRCDKHLTYITEHEMTVQPGSTHAQALENGAVHVIDGPIDPACGGLGRISYCSGYNTRTERDCVPAHSGSMEVVVAAPAAAPPAWAAFCQRVTNAWDAFVQSGYDPALRGVNNHGEYRPPRAVSQILQGSGGMVRIGNGTYTVSNSLHAEVSLHRTIPAAHQQGNIRSFIFHL